jgi:hypothetical protein
VRGAATVFRGRDGFFTRFRAVLADREDLADAFLPRAAFFAIFRLGAAFFRPARAAFFLRFAIPIPPAEGERVYPVSSRLLKKPAT